MRRLRVLLADDFGPFRAILKSVFPPTGGWELVGEASSGAEAIERARANQPDVVIMDYHMPDGDGMAAAIRILEEAPGTQILMASLSVERQYVLRALGAGVRGYLSKDDAAACLREAVATVLVGEAYLSPRAAWEITRSAPVSNSSTTQQALAVFAKEGPALMTCADRIQPESAGGAVEAAFDAYWMALRHGETIADPQTWLVLSVAGYLAPPAARMAHPHPTDEVFAKYWSGELTRQQEQHLQEHVDSCRSCYLTWTLAAHGAAPASVDALELAAMRATLAGHFAAPDEPKLFLAYAKHKAKVAQLAASELNLLLGDRARNGWLRRDAAAGSWMKTLLGQATL